MNDRRGVMARIGTAIGALLCGQLGTRAEASIADREEEIWLYRDYFIIVRQTTGLRAGYEWGAQCPALHWGAGYHASCNEARWAICECVDNELDTRRREGREAPPKDVDVSVIKRAHLG